MSDRLRGELRAATERAERATELLQRWHRLAVERWHDHATTQIDADTRAFLGSGGAPTFESLVAATGELPATGLASAEPPPNSCEDGGQTNPAVRRDRCGEADRPVARISKGMALCGPCWQVTGGAPTTGEAPATDGEWPPLRLVQLRICQACLDGEGAECHTPGCALWLHSVGPRIHRELYEIVSADPPADGIDLDLCGGCGDTCVIWRGGATLYVDDPCAWMVEDDPRGGKSWVFDCKNQDPRDERPSATPPPDPGQGGRRG